MHKRGGFQRLAGLLVGQFRGRQLAEFVVNERQSSAAPAVPARTSSSTRVISGMEVRINGRPKSSNGRRLPVPAR